jgi:hypothetical protein
MSLAWETTIEDLENVLRRLGMPQQPAVVKTLYDQLDFAAIEKAALYGDSMEEQTEFAYKEIEHQLMGD